MKTTWIKSLLTYLLPSGVKALPGALALMGLTMASPLLAADPVATWTDFNQLTSGDYTLTKDVASTVNADGSITLGGTGLELTFTAGQPAYDNNSITVVMDVSGVPNSSILTDVTSGGNSCNLYYDGSKLYQRSGTAANYGNYSWTSTRATIAFAYGAGGGNTTGTTTYLNGEQVIDASNLKWTGSRNVTKVAFPAAGMKIHSLRIYGSKIPAAEIPAWVPSASFGVNFMDGTGQEVSSTGGFAKANYEAPSNWFNVTGSANGNNSITVNGATYNVAWTAHNGTWRSDCSTDTFAGKLLYGYLDDCVNDARVKATVTVTGLPAETNYAVALLLSGDAGNNTDFNGRFSSVLINDRPYSYSGTTLISGDAALLTQTWGDRSKAAAAAGLAEGTNVMFVSGLSGETLSITSAVNEMNVARLTIAGIQVWITPNAQEKVYVRTLSGDANWTATNAWALEGSDKIVNAPADGQSAVLTVAADATVTMDVPSTLNAFTATGTKTLTIATVGENKLTATKTTVETDTVVQANAAALGVTTISEGKTLTIPDLTTVASITGAGTLNYDLGDATAEGHTFAADGGRYKVSSGTFVDTELNFSATQTTYEFAGGTIVMAEDRNDGQFSFGKADVTISGGTIYATHFITVQGQANRPTKITQTGGDIILSGTGNGSGTGMAAQTIMFGHWPSATSEYTLSGGSLVAEHGGLRFGNDSPATMEISGTGLLKVKGIKGKGTTTSALTLAGGKLSIGANGFDNINNFTMTLSGGEFNAFDFSTMNQPFTVTGNAKLSADAGKTFTIASQMTIQEGATISTDGLVVFTGALSNAGTLAVNSGSVTLAAGAIGNVTVARGATLKVKVADYAAATLTNVTLADDTASVYFVLPSGKEVKGMVNGTTVTMPAQDVYTYTAVAGEENLWSTASKWRLNGAPIATAPTGVVSTSVEVVLTGASTLMMDVADVTLSALAVSGGELTIAGQNALTLEVLTSANKVIVSNMLTLEGGAANAPRKIATLLEVTGKLVTKGALHLTAENRIAAGATVEVVTGTTALNAVDTGISGTLEIAAGATVETIGLVKIATVGTISGEGTLKGELALAEGATVAAAPATSLKLAAGTTIELPSNFNVKYEEGTTLKPGIPVVLFDRADTNMLDITGTTAVVKAGDVAIEDATFMAAATGDLIVQIPALFIAEVPAGETAWNNLAWKNVDGEPLDAMPTMLDNVLLKPMAAGAVVTYDTTPLTVNALEAEGDVAIRFNRDCVTQAMYEMIPTTISLVKTFGRIGDTVSVQLTSLKYGALATIVKTETTAEATLTLPDGAVTGNAVAITKGEMIAVNFKGNGEYLVSGNNAVGLDGYQVRPENWTQFGGTSAENQAVTIVMLDGTTKTLSNALTFSCNNGYNTQNDSSHMILRGYLDDGGNGANVSIDVPTDWLTYTAVIYCATDTPNTTFAAHEVNGQWYTYVNNSVNVSDSRPSVGWGNSNSRTDLIAGTNTMVVTGLSGNFTLVGNKSGTPRGGIAAVQLVQTGKPEYALVPGVTASVPVVTADTVVAWDELEWKDDEGNPAAEPTAATPATIVLESDVTLNLAGAVAMQVQIVGNGHKLRIAEGTAPATADFVFSSDTIYRMVTTSDVLPAKVLRMPGELRYEFAYDASREAYATIPNTISNFVAGFNGSFTAAGGGIEFSAREVNLTGIAGTGVQTQIIFSGTSVTTVAEELCIGEATVTLCDGASVTTKELSLSDGAVGYTSVLTLEDSAQLRVTGATNEDTNKASIMFGHWNGASTVILRDNARFIAEATEVLVGKTGNNHAIVLEGGEMRVRGIRLSASASGTNTITLKGGKLLMGKGALNRYGSTTMTLDFIGGALGALSDTVTLGADAAATIATLTGLPRFESEKGASLELTQREPFLAEGMAINLGGDLRLNGLTLNAIDVQGGSLTAVGAVTTDTVTIATGATLTFDSGVLTTNTCTFNNNAILLVPIRNRQSESGYLQMANGAALPDLSSAVIELVLDAERADAEKVLPEQPIALGLYTEGDEPNVRGVSLRNNTNNAITDYELALKAGNMGGGLYVTLSGTEVLRTHYVDLVDATTGYELYQNVANGRPYHYFTAKVAGAKVVTPAEGVAISHVTFAGEKTCLVAKSTEPSLLLQTNNTTITTEFEIDLSNWKNAMDAFVRGAVLDIPVSQCLISGGITVKQGIIPSLNLGDYVLPTGFTASLEVGEAGLYLVVSADRMARTVSVNFTNVATPLAAPPTKPGAYPVAVAAWNDLNKVYSSSELKIADFGGVASSIASTYLSVFSTEVVTSNAAPTSMTKVWLSDMNGQEIRLQGKPFDAYRVALIFANDVEGAAYAPIQIGESLYAMDRAGYTRRDVEAYETYHATTGLVELSVAGDTAWGSTDYPEAVAPVALGQNALVTDVLTAEALKLTLPACVYGKTYAGLAAIQIIEATTPDVVEPKDFTYTLSTAGEYNLVDLTETWVSGVNNNLTIVANADVTVTLPLNFVAKTVTVSGSGSVTLKVENDGGAALTKLDASRLTKNLTIDFPCLDVEFLAPAGVTTFEKAFNNNGQTYTIAEGATLTLGENSGITTDLDEVSSPMLQIADGSEGTLRRNYVVYVTGHFVDEWQRLTLAFKDGTRARNPDNSASYLLVESGDVYRQTGRFHLKNANDWFYTQTGGEASFEDDTAGEGGFLLFNGGSPSNKTATVTVSGGRLYATKISAWQTGTTVNLTVSGEGILALGNEGLRAQNNNARVNATFTENGTLELATSQVNVHNADRVSVTFNGGVITTSQSEASLNLPIIFNGTAAKPTKLAPMEGSTLVLNVANTGSGVIQVMQGKVAIANAAALAETSTTVKSGATFEARGFAADAAMSNRVTFEAGATLSATAEVAEGATSTTVRIAGSLVMPATQTSVQYVLNGERYTGVTVNTAAGTVTFTTKAPITAVTWDAAKSEGIWAEGVAGPWTNGATYYNGATATFVNANVDPVDVTVEGNVAPASMTWNSGSANTYRFNGASTSATLTLTGETVAMGSGQVYNLPVSTVVNAVLTGNSNTYRLIGAFSNGRKTASLVKEPATDNNTINRETTNHGAWCIDGVTLTPQPGEVQILSAMGYNGAENKVSHLSGSGDVTITGGGTVQFAGRVLATGSDEVAYQNKGFSGHIIIQEGSMLDVTMVRDYNQNFPRDDYPFFALPTEGIQENAGEPLWIGEEAGISVRNGSTFRVSGCRSIFGGWENRANTNLLASTPLEIGYQSLAEFAFADSSRFQVFPHGFRLNGDGAKLLATRDMYVSGGTTIVVAGIGDKADFADPKTDKRLTADGIPQDDETYGKLTAGITAELASSATTSFVPWTQCVTANDPLVLQVGEDSSLNISANLKVYDSVASLSRFSFKKMGAGALRFTQPLIEAPVILDVAEGILGGSATFSGAGTTVSAAAETVVEAGLSLPSLTVTDGVAFAVDPTGKRVLHADSLNFKANTTYVVKSLLNEEDCPSAVANVVTKVLSWKSAQSVTTVTFVLDDVLVNKGYGAEVRADGLYLMKGSVYVRELTEAAPSGTHRIQWYAEKKWYRQDDATKTLRNYDPQEDEAVSVLFLLPRETFDVEGALPPKQITFILNKAAAFASVRVAMEAEDDEGNPTLKLVAVPIVYEYDLTNEVAPVGGEAKRYSWVSTLTVVRENTVALASLQVRPPLGCDYTISDTTAVIYTSAATPALNLNFASADVGNAAQVATTASPCGMKPFAGVYWNNLTESTDTLLGREGNHAAWRAQVLPAGIAADENGQVTTCDVTYIVSQIATQRDRLSGSANETLLASYLSGQSAAAISGTLRGVANMTDAGTQSGWQVRVASVPFDAYDLYLILAGNADGSVSYPAIRVKVGEKAWRTFSMVNGWAAPAASNATWSGFGGLIEGKLVDGQNVLHLRVKSMEGAALEIAGWDTAQTATTGLAAIQIVRCEDGAIMERVAAGNWSDANGWRRELVNGVEQGKWIDATVETPRAAMIPVVPTLAADMMATTPYVAISGGGTMRLDGSDAVLSTGSLDLTELSSGAELAIGTDVFADPVNVLLAPDTIIDIPTTASGTVVNRWKWLTDDAGNNVNATTATIRKKLAGDVELSNPVPCKIDINDGTLWMNLSQNATMAGAISGESGTFGKKGASTLTITGQMTQGAETAVRVSEGTLQFDTTVRGVGTGKTFLADGGTIVFNAGDQGNKAVAENTLLQAIANGRIVLAGTNRFAETTRAIIDDAMLEASVSGGSHIKIAGLTLRNDGELYINHNSTDAYNSEGLLLLGDLIVENGTATIRLLNNNVNRNTLVMANDAKIDVYDGAVLNSASPIHATPSDAGYRRSLTLFKTGRGLWIQRAKLFNARGNNLGSKLTVEAGELCYNIGGEPHTIHYNDATTCPVTIQTGAKLSGNVIFPEKAPVTFEQGSIVRSGVEGVANSALTFHTVTFSKEMTFECDLVNFKPLTITNSATFSLDGEGHVTIHLMNIGGGLTEEKQLIAWPSGTNYTVTDFSSPEAVAISAELEPRDDGLWIKPTNAAHIWSNVTGNWSASEVWTKEGAAEDYPLVGDTASGSESATAHARVIASTANVDLTVDSPLSAGAYDWKALSLVMLADTGKTLNLLSMLETDEGATKGLNSVTVWYNLWKLGLGNLMVEAPVKFRANGTGTTLNVAAGTMTLKHPLVVEKPVNKDAPTIVPTAIDIAEDAILEYALDVTDDARVVIGTTYDPYVQTLTGALTGEGTLRLNGEDNMLTIQSTTDSELDLDVQQGTLVMASNLPFAGLRPAARTVKVGDGAQIDINTENAMGASTNVTWMLTAGTGEKVATITTSNDVRIRGAINVSGTGLASFGTSMAQLDSALRVNVTVGATLNLGGTWSLASNAVTSAALTKTGAGVLALNNLFEADVPVTIANGVLQLGAGAVNVSNTSDVVPAWTVNKGAALRLGGGSFNLGGNSDDAGRLAILSGGILDCAKNETEIKSPVTIADRAEFVYSDANASVSFSETVQVNGVVIINMDTLDPEKLVTSSLTLVKFNSQRSGTGSFQLGGSNLVKWAENGWTLRDNGNTVVLQKFGTDGYYTWAGDGTEGSVGEGNWQNAFWIDSKTATQDTVAWPKGTYDKPSMKLVDTLPSGELIPAEAATLDWTLPKQTIASVYVNNNEVDYTLTSSMGEADFSIDGDFLKAGDGKLTVKRATVLGSDGALRLLGGETEFTGALMASSGDFNKPVTVAGEGTTLRFSGNTLYYLKGLLEGDGQGTIIQSGAGTLQIVDPIEKMKALTIEQGAVTLMANEQYVPPTEITVNANATLTLSGTYSGAETIKMKVNAGKEAQGLLIWSATTATSSDKAPRLGGVDGVAGAAIAVDTFRYQPTKGHLVIDPNDEALKPGFNLVMAAPNEVSTAALWLGAQAELGATLRVVTLSGSGIIGVEPTIDLLSDMKWGNLRVLTVAATETDIAKVSPYTGSFMGANTPASGDIRIGLTVENGRIDTVRTYFRYGGTATDTLLGTLTIGENTAAEIAGTWAGDVDVAKDGLLMGNGIVGASKRMVLVPNGAAIAATTYGKRVKEDNTFTTELVPDELTVKGTLALETGSIVNVQIYKNQYGDTWSSLITTETLELPAVLEDGEEEVKIVVNVDLESGVVASGVKILGWDNLNGGQRINGDVYINGELAEDYQLRKKADGLYLYRKSARFLLILQ